MAFQTAGVALTSPSKPSQPITPAMIARAAAALNRCSDISAAARRVGLELLECLDKRKGVSWPSEARMAAALGVDERTIRRGKAELRQRGLIVWRQRGSSRSGRTPVYHLMWGALMALGDGIKAKVRQAAREARETLRKARNGSLEQAPTSSAAVSRAGSITINSGKALRALGRTILPRYLSHQFLKNNHQKSYPVQVLTDQQLDSAAHARIMEHARASLDPAAFHGLMVALMDMGETVLNSAVHAERFSPDKGRTGLAIIARAMPSGAIA